MKVPQIADIGRPTDVEPMTESAPVFQPRRISRGGMIFAAVAVVFALAYGGYARWGRTHVATVDPSALATEINASSCQDSGYRIKPAAGWVEVYDCIMGTGRTICVAKTGGIASNVTLITQAAFYGALGGNKPACIS